MKAERIKSLVGCLSDYAYTSDNDWEAFNELVNKAAKWDMIEQRIKSDIKRLEAYEPKSLVDMVNTNGVIALLETYLDDKRGAE